MSRSNNNRTGTFVIALLLAIAFCVSLPTATYAKKKNGKLGTVKILTDPAGLTLEVDGKFYGQTTADFRAIDLEAGPHTIVITLPSGKLWIREIDLAANRIKCVTLNYRQTVPPPACPFPISISAPSQVSEGEVITYTTDVAYAGSSPLRYSWTVSPDTARILSGAGTPTITVDSTGLGGQRITASVVVDDGSGSVACSQSVQASTLVSAAPPRENPAKQFDVCYKCSFDDQKARLDNLAVELQHDPSSTAYIISYAGRRSRASQAFGIGARARDYMVSARRVDSSRVVMLNGGVGEEESLELWIVPAGAKPPQTRSAIVRDRKVARESLER